MTHDDAARWLNAYVEAWRSYDPAAIGALFADEAEYRYHPWNKPLRGRDSIVASWTGDQDAPGSWEASYAPWAVDGNRVVATGTSRYVNPERTYHNVFLIEFDDAGKATSFTEVFIQER